MHPYLHVFGLSIPSFGVMMLLGILAAFALLYATRRRVPFTEDDLLTMAIYAIIGGFVGAKVLYWIVELDRIVADPHFILESLTSGFVFYGALIVGALAIWLFARRRRQPFLGYLDLVAPSFILAQGFGRIGCFLAGCCYGAPCDSPLSVVYPEGVSAPAGVPLLPTQLFEAAFCFLYTAVLVCIFFRQKRYGTTTGWYFVGYGVWRFIIEFFRSDDRGAVGALSHVAVHRHLHRAGGRGAAAARAAGQNARAHPAAAGRGRRGHGCRSGAPRGAAAGGRGGGSGAG